MAAYTAGFTTNVTYGLVMSCIALHDFWGHKDVHMLLAMNG